MNIVQIFEDIAQALIYYVILPYFIPNLIDQDFHRNIQDHYNDLENLFDSTLYYGA